MTILFQAKFLIFLVFFCLQFSLGNSASFRNLNCSGTNYMNEFKILSKQEVLNKLKTIIIKKISLEGYIQHVSFDFVNMKHYYTGYNNEQITSANLYWVDKPVKYVLKNLNKCAISDGGFLIGGTGNQNDDGFASIFFRQDIGYFVTWGKYTHSNSEYVISEYNPNNFGSLNIVDFKTGNLFDYFSKKLNNEPKGTLILDSAKSDCEDLGFKQGTEKFGECVLKLSE